MDPFALALSMQCELLAYSRDCWEEIHNFVNTHNICWMQLTCNARLSPSIFTWARSLLMACTPVHYLHIVFTLVANSCFCITVIDVPFWDLCDRGRSNTPNVIFDWSNEVCITNIPYVMIQCRAKPFNCSITWCGTVRYNLGQYLIVMWCNNSSRSNSPVSIRTWHSLYSLHHHHYDHWHSTTMVVQHTWPVAQYLALT